MDADLHRALVDAAAPRGRPALFLDRDGTLIEERDYLADPDGVRLLPGATATLNAFRGAGYALVLVTNQSGVGRGRFGWDAYDAVAARLRALLAEDGAALDAEFVCGHAPSPAACPWRKPGAGMIEEAARRLDIPLGRSLAVGDKASDLAAAAAAGVGSGILVLTGYGVSERDGLAALPTGFPVSVLPGLAALVPPAP